MPTASINGLDLYYDEGGVGQPVVFVHGIPAAHLIGSSSGGPIAVVFAATRPDRTKSLVLAGSGINLFDVGDSLDEVILQQIEMLRRHGADIAFQRRPRGVEISLDVMWSQREQEERGTLEEYLKEQHRLNAMAAQLPEADRVAWYAAELRNIEAYVDADVSSTPRRYALQLLYCIAAMTGLCQRLWEKNWHGSSPAPGWK